MKNIFLLLFASIAILLISLFIVQVVYLNPKLQNNSALQNQAFDPDVLYKDEWKQGIVYQTESLAADLRKVCVVDQNNKQGNECVYYDYWTNNRTGSWERLQRDNGDTEGSGFCENFEEWKVAKGMPCTRINGSDTESFVSY